VENRGKSQVIVSMPEAAATWLPDRPHRLARGALVFLRVHLRDLRRLVAEHDLGGVETELLARLRRRRVSRRLLGTPTSVRADPVAARERRLPPRAEQGAALPLALRRSEDERMRFVIAEHGADDRLRHRA
jgi:hypothetical protein